MNPKLTAQVLVVLSIVYGISVALLAIFHPSATQTFAIVGALAIGGLWAIRGVFLGRGSAE